MFLGLLCEKNYSKKKAEKPEKVLKTLFVLNMKQNWVLLNDQKS